MLCEDYLSHCTTCKKKLKNNSKVLFGVDGCICMKCFKKIGGNKTIQNFWEGNCIFLVKDIKEEIKNGKLN